MLPADVYSLGAEDESSPESKEQTTDNVIRPKAFVEKTRTWSYVKWLLGFGVVAAGVTIGAGAVADAARAIRGDERKRIVEEILGD